MKPKLKKILNAAAFCIIYFILIWLSLTVAVSYHEDSHKQIFASYGIDSEINFTGIGDGGLTAPNMTQYSKYCDNKCKELQNWAEIIGYHSMAAIYAAWFITTAIILFIILRSNNKNEKNR